MEVSEKQTRKQYSDEYKSEAVRLVRESGKPLSQIARELGINDNMLARLRRELARVTAERDFLKRAAAFFAKDVK
jgi:transposase